MWMVSECNRGIMWTGEVGMRPNKFQWYRTGASLPEDAGEEPIGPLPGVGVQHSVQVLLRDGLQGWWTRIK